MRLTVTYVRPSGSPVDLSVTADASVTVGQLGRVLLERDPQVGRDVQTPTLMLPSGEVLPANLTVAASRVQSGAEVRVVAAPTSDGGASAQSARAQLLVLSGPAGQQEPIPLSSGVHTVGRDYGHAVRLVDPQVSRTHAQLVIGDSVEIVDLGSANGVFLGGQRVERTALRPDDVVVLGDTRIRVVHNGAASADPEGNGELFNRSPRLESRYLGGDFEAPEPPSPQRPAALQWTPFLAPLLLGPALYLVTGRLATLLFLALGPLLLVGGFLERRRTARRDYEQAVDVHRAALAALREELDDARREEQAARSAEHPATQELTQAARTRAPLLWSSRPDRPGFLELRLGAGQVPSRNRVVLPRRRSADVDVWQELLQLQSKAERVGDVPIVADLREAGSVGVAGARPEALTVMRALLAQLVCRHSPAELVVAAVVAADHVEEWQWLKWLPHTSSQDSPVPGDQLAAGAVAGARLVAALEDLVQTRASTSAAAAHPLPAVVLLVEDAAPVDRSRLVALAEQGAAVSVHLLWLAASVERLPAACRAFVELRGVPVTASVGLVVPGQRLDDVQCERLGAEGATALGRSMAPLVDAGARKQDQSDLPPSAGLLQLLPEGAADQQGAVVDAWRTGGSLPGPEVGAGVPSQSRTGLRAMVGVGAGQPFVLDLREHGPHALVGGTTGAGKSEFLQTWVAAMAAAHSPLRVTFLFVDYKGEAAFGDCIGLPHSVGLVSDLNPHLVRRALTSLRAELRYREEVLREHKAKDLLDLERRGVPGRPPSLVIVVDEFAALAKEVPEFVDGVVDVAQRGRSLGLHLVLATQRPAGVIRDSLRANTNLRIALRLADADDSNDVLGVPDAAGFDPALPGRAMAKLGPGRVTPFQAAYVGGRTPETPPAPPIVVLERPFGTGGEWEPAPSEVADGSPADGSSADRQTDLTRLVNSVQRAHEQARIPTPRRPWLPELEPVYGLHELYEADNPHMLHEVPQQRSDSELVFGVQDDPSQQRRTLASFVPDRDGSMAVFGTGGSGKSTFLRTLALAAARTPDGGPCHVYGLDFGAQGLRMLDPHPSEQGSDGGSAPAGDRRLPHVGAVIAGDDDERVVRLLRTLREIVDERAVRFARVSAGTIAQYRQLARRPDEPRILLLVDGLGAFRSAYEVGVQARWFEVFQSIVADGRAVGVHVVLSADRSTALPGGLAALVQRRLVLRLAGDGNEAALLRIPAGAFSLDTPAGRGFLDGAEVQVAVLGGSASTTQQAEDVEQLAVVAQADPVWRAAPPRPVGRLRERLTLQQLPAWVAGAPALGVEDLTLEATGFHPSGTLLVTGPPGSGRTSLLAMLTLSFRRSYGPSTCVYLGVARSPLLAQMEWDQAAEDVDDIASLAKDLAGSLADPAAPAAVIVVENLPELLNTPADAPLQQLVRTVRRTEALLIADGETSAMTSSFGLLQLVKQGRHGIALQPDQTDGDAVFKTTFPRVNKAAFPPGRGFYVHRGRVLRVQCALPEEEPLEPPLT